MQCDIDDRECNNCGNCTFWEVKGCPFPHDEDCEYYPGFEEDTSYEDDCE